MIMIGEIRDQETMQHAIAYAETGHLCVSTLHASNASQAIKRILNFFAESAHAQLRMDLSLNLTAIVAQRLVPALAGGRALATEVLLQSAHVADLIERGAVDELRQSLEKTSVMGTHGFWPRHSTGPAWPDRCGHGAGPCRLAHRPGPAHAPAFVA